MKSNKKILPLDQFIDFSLYDKNSGFYMKKNPFGKEGHFITAPNISILFSEIMAVWIISFWENLDCPKKFNLIELGAGNGEMMKSLINTFHKFPKFLKSCQIIIHEKSEKLIKIQKKKIKKSNVKWKKNLKKIEAIPSIFIANEFFDSLPIKQFTKKNNIWYEKYINFENGKKPLFIDKEINIKNFEKKININISKSQNIIEYSPLATIYLKMICKIIKKNDGGMLIIDYGNFNKVMKNSLRAVHVHKFTNILNNINFNLFNNIIKKISGLKTILTTQKDFLIKMGIIKRAEIISKRQTFLKKIDIYHRLKRLIDKNQMGIIFKVMLIINKKSNFKIGF